MQFSLSRMLNNTFPAWKLIGEIIDMCDDKAERIELARDLLMHEIELNNKRRSSQKKTITEMATDVLEATRIIFCGICEPCPES